MRPGGVTAIFNTEHSKKGDQNVVQPNHALVITLTTSFHGKQEHDVNDL
jgi:hypothetical protein